MAEYEAFAGIYDRLMEDFDYPAWAEYYLALLRLKAIDPGYIVECGCGTGSLSVEFARHGKRVLGVDKSESMLEIAAQRARAAGVSVQFVRQDMTHLTLGRRADVVLATCDAVNYCNTPRAATAFFRRAHAALKAGGALVFDISSRYKLETIIGNAPFFEERDDIVYLWKNALNAEAHTLTMDLTFFVREKSGLYRRFEETHHQRAHSEAEIRTWLADALFREVYVYGDKTFDPPGEKESRIHIIAIK